MSARNLIEGEAMLDDDEENEEELPDDYDGEVRNGPAKPTKNADNDSSEEDEEEDDEEAARAVRWKEKWRVLAAGMLADINVFPGPRRVHRRRR